MEINAKEAYIESMKTKDELAKRRARTGILPFTEYTMPEYVANWHHRVYTDYIDKFIKGEIQNLMIFMPPQTGKLLPANTPIWTTKGWKKHGELCKGDFVFGQDGKPKAVLCNSGIYKWPVNKIIFNDGQEILASKEHLWKLRVEYDNHKGRQDVYMETKDIFNRKHRRSPYIECAPALKCAKKELPIDPYILGCWLGDGNSRMGKIHVGSEDIEHFSKLGISKEVKKGIYEVRIIGLTVKLRLNNLLLNKHIPIEYMLASKEQRIALLQGLMDTDGCVGNRTGRCEFTQMKGQLAEDVYLLLRTLGYKATMKNYDAKLYGRIVGIKTRIFFSPDATDNVFRLERKNKRVRNKKAADRMDKYKLFIRRIEETEEIADGNCIMVEGGMYLAGVDLIPTHNSEIATRRLPAYLLGLNPNLKLSLTAYNQSIASKFNRNVQRIMDSEEYCNVFPDVRLSGNTKENSTSTVKNTYEFEVVGHKGSLVSVGVNGPLTSLMVDIAIMDDLYKDPQTAWSPTVRGSVQEWYEGVLRPRLHNDSQQLIVFTRWHEEDLGGYLQRTEPEKWEVVLFEAIKTAKARDYDTRQVGEALWPVRHSLESLESIRDKNSIIFDSLYQQDPTPKEGLLLPISELELFNPDMVLEGLKLDGKGNQINPPDGIISMCDTADEGDDSLAQIMGYIYGKDIYIMDVIFTAEPIEVTKPICALQINEHNPSFAHYESNAGGKSYAMGVKELVTGKTIVKWKPTTMNKHTKIVMASGNIKKHFKFRRDYEGMREYSNFMYELSHYPKNGKVKNDDAIDCVSMLSDITSTKGGIDFLR